jgi:menaquinol-cytochrome c reductase iron-sulfur subunit
MQDARLHGCGCGGGRLPEGQSRRGFFRKSLAILSAGAALAVPAAIGIAAFLNPLRQHGAAGRFVRLASLDTLPEDGTPRKISVIAERIDAWTRSPAQPIGAVFLRRVAGDVKVAAFQVQCPHAGCSIEYEGAANGGKFFCPCHAASFDLSGKRTGIASQSPRDMDSLAVEVRNGSEVWVKFENFGLGSEKKVRLG